MTNTVYPLVVDALSAADGGGFVAFAPDLPGCMGDGATPEEAQADAWRAVDEWLDEARRLGRPVPLPGSAMPELQAAGDAAAQSRSPRR